MLFISKLFKKHTLSLTSFLSLGSHIFVLILFFIIYKSVLNKEDFFDIPDEIKPNPEDYNFQSLKYKYKTFEFNNLNIFYFTIVTHTTLGYGDLVPKSPRGKRLVSFHMVIVLLLVAFFGSN